MEHKQIVEGLMALGFNSGWAVRGNEIVIWENSSPQPSMKEILEASKTYVAPEPTVAEKLASAGLNLDDLKVALGL